MSLTSIMISFIVALVFRGFVIEGFQIPTGSMGPTLPASARASAT